VDGSLLGNRYHSGADGSHVRKAPDPTTASVGAGLIARHRLDAGDQGAVVIAHLETVGPRELLRRFEPSQHSLKIVGHPEDCTLLGRAVYGPLQWQYPSPTMMTAGIRLLLVAAALAVSTSAGLAQEIDFSGQWAPIYHEDGPERLPGPELGDYLGLPINDAARLRADSYDADRISAVSEYQCRQHAADYGMRGLANMRVTADIDPLKQRLLAFHTRIGFHDAERTIYLDGRAHPPDTAPHTWSGFSTGVYEGNMLTIKTTHLKAYYIRRNGVPASDRRTMTEHWVRHGEFLTVVTVIDDPVFLTERLVRSQSWALDPGQTMGSNWCEYAAELPLGDEAVPHYLPGSNPYLKEFSTWYGINYDATRGGAETMYPEYRSKLPQTWSTLDKCGRYCQCFNAEGGCALRQGASPF